MNTLSVLVVVVAFLGVVAARDPIEEKQLFRDWITKHNKVYSAEELPQRFSVFRENLKKIDDLNQQYPRTQFGANKFADLSEEEFRRFYLSSQVAVQDPSWPVAPEYPESALRVLPPSMDWRPKGAVTPVKNQGQCGSCWAFSTTGNIEGQWFLAGHNLTGLSEQNLVDCDHECMTYEGQQTCDQGCNGGLMPNAYHYAISAGGLDTEASYPYEGVDDTCRFNKANVGATISSFYMIPKDEAQMAAYLVNHGPVSIAVDAGAWQFYVGGVFYLPCGTTLDHGVLIVGYGTETDILDQTMPYWTIKNSWGGDWGDEGYIYVERGVGRCGVDLFPSSSIV